MHVSKPCQGVFIFARSPCPFFRFLSLGVDYIFRVKVTIFCLRFLSVSHSIPSQQIVYYFCMVPYLFSRYLDNSVMSAMISNNNAGIIIMGGIRSDHSPINCSQLVKVARMTTAHENKVAIAQIYIITLLDFEKFENFITYPPFKSVQEKCWFHTILL